MQVAKSGRDLSAPDSIHNRTALGSVCIANRLVRQEMSLTPSCTMQYFYLTGQLPRTGIVRAKPSRCTGNLHSRKFWDNTCGKTTTPSRYRSTYDTVMKYERSSLVRGFDLPKCHSAHTSDDDMWRGPGRTHWQGGDEPDRQATSPRRRCEYTTRNKKKKVLYFVETTRGSCQNRYIPTICTSVGDRSENDRRSIFFNRRPQIGDLRSFGRSLKQ